MRQAVELVEIVNLVLFAAIAVVAVRQWRREPGRNTGLWAALAFVTLAWVIVAGRLFPTDPEDAPGKVVERIDLAIFLLFPYLLYRFSSAFYAGKRPLARFVDMLSTLLVIATFALPYLPAEGESWPWWFVLYAIAFLVHWSVLLTLVAVRLWLAGRAEATVARRRMRMLAFASVAITAALLLAVAVGDDDSVGALVVALIATLSAVAFILGFSPPSVLRVMWRRPEQARVQQAIGQLMTATSEEDVAARVLEPMALIVGARGVALEDTYGRRIGTHGTVDRDAGHELTTWAFPFGRLLVHTSAFAPYFGDEERKLAADARLPHRSRARSRPPLRAGARGARRARARRRAEEPVRRSGGARAPLSRSARSTGSRRRSPSGSSARAGAAGGAAAWR